MAIENWIAGAKFALKPGYALFDTSSNWHHAMLVREMVPGAATEGLRVKVAHMRPPLKLQDDDICHPAPDHWIAWIPHCSDDDLDEMLREFARLENLMPLGPEANSCYHLGTHTLFEQSPNDPDFDGGVILQASCASFLEHCYERIEIDLVDEESVPSVGLEELAKMVGERPKRLEAGLRAAGYRADWPIQVLMPAYQMEAFRDGWPRQPDIPDHPWTG